MYMNANPQLWTPHNNILGLDEEKMYSIQFYPICKCRQEISHHN